MDDFSLREIVAFVVATVCATGLLVAAGHLARRPRRALARRTGVFEAIAPQVALALAAICSRNSW